MISVIFAFFLNLLGFIIMSALFMALLLRWVGRERWLKLSIVTILTIISSYFVFKVLLGIQLPIGLFGF